VDAGAVVSIGCWFVHMFCRRRAEGAEKLVLLYIVRIIREAKNRLGEQIFEKSFWVRPETA
jgi:hypothetical protein